jgi:heat shock protein HslJ
MAEELSLERLGEPDPRLEGTWRLIEIDGVRAPSTAGRWPQAMTVKFHGGQVDGRVACNGFFGPYRTRGAALETGLGQTTMGCGPTDAWDFVTMGALKGGEIEVDPNRLVLTIKREGRSFKFRRKRG